MSAFVVGRGDSAKTLLAGSIPDLHFDCAVVEI